jgi:hypothetical protein
MTQARSPPSEQSASESAPPRIAKLYAPQHWHDAPGKAELVSIIMRTKDRPLLLPRALASVLSQEFADWKLYLVNDGGDQPALEATLSPYKTAFGDKLELINHETPMGMEAASNAGLAAARGQFFAIHDDDDSWHPDFLGQTTGFLADPSNCAYAGVATACDVVQERVENGEIVKLAQFPWAYFRPPVEFGAMVARNQMPPITLLMRREVLARIGTYNADLPVLGDWEFILRVLMVGDIGAIETSLAYYHHRIAAGQTAYANSVSAGLNIHRQTKAALGNHIIRQSLQSNPALLGVLWPVLQAIEANTQAQSEILRRLRQIEDQLDKLSGMIDRQISDPPSS